MALLGERLGSDSGCHFLGAKCQAKNVLMVAILILGETTKTGLVVRARSCSCVLSLVQGSDSAGEESSTVAGVIEEATCSQMEPLLLPLLLLLLPGFSSGGSGVGHGLAFLALAAQENQELKLFWP